MRKINIHPHSTGTILKIIILKIIDLRNEGKNGKGKETRRKKRQGRIFRRVATVQYTTISSVYYRRRGNVGDGT